MGPKAPRSTVRTPEEEAAAVAFRRHTLLPLDDCVYALQATIPHLTRSSLHRLLKRHGISRLPEVGGDKPGKQAFKTHPIGFFHIDIAEVRTEEGKLYLLPSTETPNTPSPSSRPGRTGYRESFNGRLRDEFLIEPLVRSLGHARTVLETWRRNYNDERPHSKLGWLTPRAYAEALCGEAAGAAALRQGSAPPALASHHQQGSDHARTVVTAE